MVPRKSEGVSRYEDLQIDISSGSQTRVTHRMNLVEGLIQFGSGQKAKLTYRHVIGNFWCKILSSMPVQIYLEGPKVAARVKEPKSERNVTGSFVMP